jgi:hypothetical protein
MNEKAEALSVTRKNISEIEERLKLELEPLKAAEAILKEQLIHALNGVGLKSITAQSGEAYHISTSYEFEFKNDAKGLAELQYAREHNLLRPDRVALKKSLREQFAKDALPKGVEAFEKQIISVRRQKEETEA